MYFDLVLTFQGVWPTAQRAAIIAAVELPVYDFCKAHFIPYLGDTVANHFTYVILDFTNRIDPLNQTCMHIFFSSLLF